MMYLLQWTTQPPTMSGQYWYRNNSSGKVKIKRIGEEHFRYMSGPHPRFEWAGPIPEPIEADQCEHCVTLGDWCQECHRDYKKASEEQDNEDNIKELAG